MFFYEFDLIFMISREFRFKEIPTLWMGWHECFCLVFRKCLDMLHGHDRLYFPQSISCNNTYRLWRVGSL